MDSNLCLFVFSDKDNAKVRLSYILALHSSKRVLVEQIPLPEFFLTDAIIQLTLAREERKCNVSKVLKKQMSRNFQLQLS